MSSRVNLSIGATTAAKVVTVVVAVFMIGVGVLAALLALGVSLFAARTTIDTSVGDGAFHIDEQGNLVPGPAPEPGLGLADGFSAVGVIGVVCATVVALLALYLVLRVWRTAAWLEGTVLNVRGAFTTRAADLATSLVTGGSRLQAVGAGESRTVHRVQVLQAADPRSGKSVILPLRGAGLAMLPGDQLTALADAITRGRSRTEATEAGFVVAERLRDLARDPFA